MKSTVIVLAMLLMAATTFSQSDRRTTNRERSAQRTTETRRPSNNNQTTVQQKSSNEATQTRQAQPSRTETKSTETQRPTPQEPNRNVSQDHQRTMSNDHHSTRERREYQDNKPVRNEPQRHTPQHQPSQHAEHAPAHHPEHNNIRHHAVYTKPHKDYASPRVYREKHVVVHHVEHPPLNRSYRSQHHVYRAPVEINLVWTPVMHRRYIEIYPMIDVWYYPVGHRIQTISAYDALYYKGEVMNVYGQVSDIFYSHSTDEYFLYVGPYYPYQDFSIVIPGWIARAYSPQPMRFFNNQYITVTGLITEFEGIPEVVVKDRNQVNLY